MYSFPNFEPIFCSMSHFNCCFLSCIQVSLETGKVVCYIYLYASAVLSCFSCVQLFVTRWTVACQALLSMGFSRLEYWEWVVVPSSRGSSWPRDQTDICDSCIVGGFFTTEPLGKPSQLYTTIQNVKIKLKNVMTVMALWIIIQLNRWMHDLEFLT